MKLVIDISEETYKAIMKPFSTFKEQRTHKSVITEACIAIANGKPQEQKTGHWKRISIDKYVQHAMAYYKCSECGKDIIGYHNYCPNCGAKMVELKESAEPHECNTCKFGSYYKNGYDVTTMDDECGGCCEWNDKWQPKEESEDEK